MNGLTTKAQPRLFELMGRLAEPTRTRLLLVLEGHEFTVSELCSILQMPQSTVSRHLKVLADDGWLVSHPDGTSRRYRMVTRELDSEAQELWELVRDRAAELPAARQDELRVRSVLAERRSASEQFFADAAGHWDRLRAELFGEQIDLQALVALADDRWVVGDLGCGTGRVSECLAPYVRQVVAVDGSPEMLQAARSRLAGLDNVEVRAGQLESLPLQDAELDLAVLFLVLHYVADPKRVLSEVARVLRPGGRVLLVDITPHDRHVYQRQMGHVWLGFSPQQIHDWMQQAGLEPGGYRTLAPDPMASGPAAFTSTGRRPQRD